jgi:hypothetical protein
MPFLCRDAWRKTENRSEPWLGWVLDREGGDAMFSMHSKCFAPLLGLGLLAVPASGRAAEATGYDFPAAAQEITQLFWLAETANVCGWTSAEDVIKFKLFAMRFLGAHLSERNREALASLVLAKGYEERVRSAAEEGAGENCGSNRWRLGWVSYKTAADDHAGEY